MSRTPVHIILIVSLGFLVYSNTLHAPFQFDDQANIVDNTAIRSFEVFRDPLKIKELDSPVNAKVLFGTRYVGFLTFALNYRLHGLDVFGYHVVNIAIHIINALLVYWLIRLSFRTPFFKGSIFDADAAPAANKNLVGIIALFSSLLFVAHPLQTQAVTYIVQRLTSLATLFFLLSLTLYIRARLSESVAACYGIYCASIVSASLAMLTKEISITLPVIIGLYEFMFFKGKMGKRFLFLLPAFLTVLIIPFAMITVNSAIADLDTATAFRIAGSKSISQWEYLLTQFRVIVTYIRLMFPPVVQNLDYDYPIYRSFFDMEIVLSVLFLLSLFGFGIYLLRRSSRLNMRNNHILRLSAFGIFWFFITLSVESSIIPIHDVIFEHRVYLPSVGFFTAIVALIISARIFLLNKLVILKKALVPVLAVIVLILSGAAYVRNTIWQDEIKLWEDVVKKSPNKARVHYNLGVIYDKKGRIYEAIEEYLEVIKLSPNHADAYNNLGAAYAKTGHPDKAVEKFYIAAKLRPEDADIQKNFRRASEELAGRRRQ